MLSEKILIIEDEDAWVQLFGIWLKNAGYVDVYFARNGREGVEESRRIIPDCILLDLVLPDMDGMEVCKLIRSIPALGKTPVIMITGHRKEKIMGLDFGADYFVQKADNPAELLATLRALFRRRELDADIYRKGDVSLHLGQRHVFFKDLRVAELTPKTFDLFYILLERSPEPVHKELLYSAVEGRKPPELSRALDVLMNRLRKALPRMLQDRIKAVKGFGYVYLTDSVPRLEAGA